MSHITASAFLSCFVGGEGGRREKVSHVLVWEKVSHVTVSGAWREEGQGVTCNGFLGGSGSRGVGKGEHWYSHCMHHCVLHPRADALTQRSWYTARTLLQHMQRMVLQHMQRMVLQHRLHRSRNRPLVQHMQRMVLQHMLS